MDQALLKSEETGKKKKYVELTGQAHIPVVYEMTGGPVSDATEKAISEGSIWPELNIMLKGKLRCDRSASWYIIAHPK